MKKWIIVNALSACLILGGGCLATKLLLPGQDPLTTEERAKLDKYKSAVNVAVQSGAELNKILIPGGGAGIAALTWLGWYLKRRAKRK